MSAFNAGGKPVLAAENEYLLSRTVMEGREWWKANARLILATW
jgi:hypothetical protein